jgi:hypothetical protein
MQVIMTIVQPKMRLFLVKFGGNIGCRAVVSHATNIICGSQRCD